MLSVDHDLVSLGEVAPGVASSASVVLSNTGGGSANLRGLVSGSEFAVSSDCPTDLAPGASCTISVTFTATTAGTHTFPLLIKTSAEDEGLQVTFYAKVIGDSVPTPELSFSTPMAMFSSVNVGESNTQQFTLTNVGTANATLLPLASSPEFAIQSDCPTTLAINGHCTVSATFTGTAAGTAPAYLLIAKAQRDVSASVLLQGRVNGGNAGGNEGPGIVFNPEGLGFGNVWLQQSASRQAVLTNNSAVTASIKSVVIDLGSGDFTQVNDCGGSVAAGASCTFSVKFTPAAMDSRLGRVLVTFADNSQQVLSLYGFGIYAGLSVGPSTVQYGGVVTSGALPERSVWLGNGGNIPLTGLNVVNNDSRLSVRQGNCTTSLPARQGCGLLVSYTPAGEGPFSTSFQVTSTNGGSATVNVTGTVVKLIATPAQLTFPSTTVGKSAPDQSFTLTNAGQAEVALDGVSVTYGVESFNQSNNCGGTMVPGASCTVTVRFTPRYEGALTGSVDVSAAGSLVLRAGLSGTGYVPRLSLSSNSLPFPATNVGKSSAPLSVIITNQANVDADIRGISIVDNAAEFAQSNNCGTSLAVSASCTVTVQWTPRTTAASSGSLAIDTSLGTYGVSLSGDATQPVAVITKPTGPSNGTEPEPVTTPDGVTHISISFPDTQVGMSSNVRNITFSNSGDGPLSVQGISVVAGASDFAQSNDCGAAIAPGSSCTISMRFTPAAAGARSGQIVIASDTGTYAFDLTGKGLGALVQLYAESSPSFGNVVVGSTAQRTFTFLNTGSVAASNVIAELTGVDVTFTANSCGTPDAPATVAPNGTCSMTVQYSPKQPGALEAGISVNSNASNGVQLLGVEGMGVQAVGKLTADTSRDFGTVFTNTSSKLNFTFANSGDADATKVVATVEGAGMRLTSNTCGTADQPGVLGIGKICTMTVQFTPTAAGQVSGALSVASSAVSSPHAIELTGSGKYSSNSYALQFNGTNGSTAIGDTGTGATWRSYNGAAVTTNIYREGTGALNLNGTNQAVYGPAIAFTSDFTASAWVRPTALPGTAAAIMGQWRRTLGQGAWLLSLRPNGTLWFSYAPYSEMDPMLTTSSSLPLNQWSQVAITKTGATVKLSVNGVVVASGTSNGNAAALDVPFAIGSFYEGNGALGAFDYFAGQIDDVRVLTGSGAGDVSFEAATLSAPDVDFGQIDVGTTVTKTVTVRNSGRVPATIGAVSTSGDFAIKDAATCTAGTLAPGASCSITLTFTPLADGASTGALTLKYDANGATAVALSGSVRIADPAFDKVALLMHLDGSTSDVKGHTVTGTGLTFAASPLGGQAAVHSGNSSFVSIPNSPDFDFGAGDFTIELSAAVTSTYGAFIGRHRVGGDFNSGSDFLLYGQSDGTLWFFARTTSGIVALPNLMPTPADGKFHHYAIVRAGATFTVYVDGVAKGSASSAGALSYSPTQPILTNIWPGDMSSGFSGRFDEIRITKGLARYTKNFTPPTQPFPNQ
jgi:hypothetical protein